MTAYYYRNFNPRLREGGDNVTRHITIWIQYFNPRLREGGDYIHGMVTHYFNISIHASAKEATKMGMTRESFYNNFNPRLREGGDKAIPSVE